MDLTNIKAVNKIPRSFKQARQINKLKMTAAADKLGISQPTLSAWEGERKSPSIDGLEHMADLYGVTTDYLLGRTDKMVFQPRNLLLLMLCQSFMANQSGSLITVGYWSMRLTEHFFFQVDRHCLSRIVKPYIRFRRCFLNLFFHLVNH